MLRPGHFLPTHSPMIKTINLRFGRAPGTAPEAVQTTPITVFVGPNNSGKSRVLQELYRFLQSGQRSTADLILDHVEFAELTHERAEAQIKQITLAPKVGETVHPNH